MIIYICAVKVRDGCEPDDVKQLTHAALNHEEAFSNEMLLIPCLRQWLPRMSWDVVNTHPTCLRCVVSWKSHPVS